MAVAAFLTVEMRFVAHSAWRPVMLYDGDSLTLPILWNAVAHGEPLHQVMSPQLLVFPEAVVYSVARLCTRSVTASLVLVAYLNVILFYLGLRAVGAVVVDGSADRRRIAALVPTLLLIAAMLLERVMGLDATTIATPFLFDSFYAGVILVGLGALAFAGHQLRAAAHGTSRRRVAAGVAAAGVLGLTIISDPLFLVQVMAPLLLVATVAFAFGLLDRSQLAWLAGPHVAAVVAYVALAPLYQRYLGENGSGYVHPHLAGAAYRTLDRDLHLILRNTPGRAEVALLAAAWTVGLVTTVALAAKVRAGRSTVQPPEATVRPGRSTGQPVEATVRLLIGGVAVVASVSILPVVVVVGQGVPRYLLPMVTFPLVALVPAANLRSSGRLDALTQAGPTAVRKAARTLAAGLVTAVTVLGLTAVPGAAAILGPATAPVDARYGTPAGETCLESAFGGRAVDGVAGYWMARALDIANRDGQRILQVRRDKTIFPWLVNLGAYEHRRFTFVLVDGWRHAELTMRRADVADLGHPARIVACPGFAVYTYPPGTVGYGRLNATIDRSLQADLKRFG